VDEPALPAAAASRLTTTRSTSHGWWPTIAHRRFRDANLKVHLGYRAAGATAGADGAGSWFPHAGEFPALPLRVSLLGQPPSSRHGDHAADPASACTAGPLVATAAHRRGTTACVAAESTRPRPHRHSVKVRLRSLVFHRARGAHDRKQRRLLHKPPRSEFPWVPVTTARLLERSNRSPDVLACPEMGSQSVAQSVDCESIQSPGVCATPSTERSRPHPHRVRCKPRQRSGRLLPAEAVVRSAGSVASRPACAIAYQEASPVSVRTIAHRPPDGNTRAIALATQHSSGELGAPGSSGIARPQIPARSRRTSGPSPLRSRAARPSGRRMRSSGSATSEPLPWVKGGTGALSNRPGTPPLLGPSVGRFADSARPA
jgi:hypothetical protein